MRKEKAGKWRAEQAERLAEQLAERQRQKAAALQRRARQRERAATLLQCTMRGIFDRKTTKVSRPARKGREWAVCGEAALN